MKISKQAHTDALDRLRAILKPGTTLHTILRHVSRSGMQRRIDVYLLHEGEAQYLSGYVSHACGYRRHKDGGLVVGGCGMDMGFAIVYELASVLYPDGFGCIGRAEGTGPNGRDERCPSNDHSNGDRDYTRHGSTVLVTGSVAIKGPAHDCHPGCIPFCQIQYGNIGTYEPKHVAYHWHQSGGYALRHEWL